MDDGINISDIEGREVVANNGSRVGRISAVYISPVTLCLQGIEVESGPKNPKEYFSSEFVSQITNGRVHLNIFPAMHLVGKKVFDSQGKRVGVVTEVYRDGESNDILSFEVDRGFLRGRASLTGNSIRDIHETITVDSAEA